MKNTKNFLLSIAATAILFSCSDDDSAIEDSVTFEETANSITSGAYILQQGEVPLQFDLETIKSNSPVEVEDQRSNSRPVHSIRVLSASEDSDPDGSFTSENNARIRFNTAYNPRTNRRRGTATFLNRITSTSAFFEADFETRTAAVWVSRNGKRGVYAGRVTNVNSSVFESVFDRPDPDLVEKGGLYITYFRVNDAGEMFTGPTVVLPRGSFTNNEIADEIFPGGDFAFGAVSTIIFNGEELTLPPFNANERLDGNSIVNLRRRNRIN